MKITFGDNEYNIENHGDEVISLLGRISAEAMARNMVISHVFVDDQEVYAQLEEIINSIDLESVSSITIIAVSKQDYEINILTEGYRYIIRAIPEIEKLAVSFYTGGLNEDWRKFQDFIEGLQWLIQINESGIAKRYIEGNDLIQIEAELKEQPSKLLVCLENQDLVMLADMISYEVLPVVKRLAEQLSIFLENEVNMNQ